MYTYILVGTYKCGELSYFFLINPKCKGKTLKHTKFKGLSKALFHFEFILSTHFFLL